MSVNDDALILTRKFNFHVFFLHAAKKKTNSIWKSDRLLAWMIPLAHIIQKVESIFRMNELPMSCRSSKKLTSMYKCECVFFLLLRMHI